jgi:hypothetical protein
MALIDKDGDENENLMETMNLLVQWLVHPQFFLGVSKEMKGDIITYSLLESGTF